MEGLGSRYACFPPNFSMEIERERQPRRVHHGERDVVLSREIRPREVRARADPPSIEEVQFQP